MIRRAGARRPWLLPLVPVYGAALWLKRRLVEGRAEYQRWLAWPVVSVGSLSAGGAGKTPVVAALADLLARAGYEVDVLSRGYRREASTLERVDAEGTADRFGDEPLVLARTAGVPVYVGADRYAAGLLAEWEFLSLEELMSQTRDTGHRNLGRDLDPVRRTDADAGWKGQVHLLDDGFQHRRLGRALDVVLLTRRDVKDWLLPAGDLREPLGRLRVAGVVVVREEEEAALRPVIRQLASSAMPVWVVRRRLELSRMEGRMLAFCGIARPEGFFAMLRAGGVGVVETVVFRDHHRYRERDVVRLLAVARRCGANGFVTTEKDAVKLSGAMRERLGMVGLVIVAGLSVRFLDEAAVLTGIQGALEIASEAAHP